MTPDQAEKLDAIHHALFDPVPIFWGAHAPRWYALELVCRVLTDDVDPGEANTPRFAYWTALMQQGAATSPAAVAAAKDIADELAKRLQA